MTLFERQIKYPERLPQQTKGMNFFNFINAISKKPQLIGQQLLELEQGAHGPSARKAVSKIYQSYLPVSEKFKILITYIGSLDWNVPIDMTYKWANDLPDRNLKIHISKITKDVF